MGMTAIASRVIKRFGRSASLIREGTTTGPSWSPTIGEPTVTPCTAALTRYSEAERAGTLISETDRKVIVSMDGLSVVPTVADKLRVDGDDYSIQSVQAVETKGSVHLYTLRVSL
jgi:hypothetical protein